MTRVLITGVGGFTGLHLASHLLESRAQVFGLAHTTISVPSILSDRVKLYSGDIRNLSLLEEILSATRPDVIYHLAGIIKSDRIQDFYDVNILGTVALFEAILKSKIKVKVLITSSSAVYGRGVGEEPLTEDSPLQPSTHYGVSKVAQESVAQRYYVAFHLNIVRTRAFNLLGPGQPPSLACSSFARQIAFAEQAHEPEARILARNLVTNRDFLDVRDAVRAYHRIAELGLPGHAYNVCSGQATPISLCLELLSDNARVPTRVVTGNLHEESTDVSFQVGSARKLMNCTSWVPQIPLRRSLADLLDYWRAMTRDQRRQLNGLA